MSNMKDMQIELMDCGILTKHYILTGDGLISLTEHEKLKHLIEMKGGQK